MLEDAISKWNINRKSYMIGDKFSDYLAQKSKSSFIIKITIILKIKF